MQEMSGGYAMRLRTPLFLLATLFVLVSACSSPSGCPTCGTTKNGAFTLINVIPVPEHNPTGNPGGPFAPFDISVVDPKTHLFYVSDRIGLAVVVVDTINNLAVNTINGANAVVQAGNNASACINGPAGPGTIPPLRSALGNFTRFGCRTLGFTIPGFGANGLFGGVSGAPWSASRAHGVAPLSVPFCIIRTS